MPATPAAKALQRWMAVDRLIVAAEALLDCNYDSARAAHMIPPGPFTDADWREGDIDHFKLCNELRRALKAAKKVMKESRDG